MVCFVRYAIIYYCSLSLIEKYYTAELKWSKLHCRPSLGTLHVELLEGSVTEMTQHGTTGAGLHN